MSFLQLFFIALALSMDAFAVSICKGLSMKGMRWNHAVLIGLYFGSFQAVMPLIGYVLGAQFQQSIERYDHWIAFLLLGIIGINMMRESFSKEEESCDEQISPRSMLPLSVATSIDALAVGVTLAFLKINIVPSVSLIGITTFVLSIIGVKVGNVFGTRYKSRAEFIGGLVLVLIGCNILLDHIGILQRIMIAW